MLTRSEVTKQLQIDRIIGIVRLNDASNLVELAQVLQDAGVNFLEITLTTPNAFEAIEKISEMLDDDFYVGAGTVTTLNLAEKAIKSGAKFIVSPNFKKEVIEISHSNSIPAMPGCLTPTEIFEAHEAGADVIKIFPSSLGGTAYLKEMRGPFPEIKFMPTGSIDRDVIVEYLKVGAFCLGIGTSMIKPDDVYQKNWKNITESIAQVQEKVAFVGATN
jgi:2-dehydro-3-deoxyphosphogluconate aldolase/(4S)-4-hydroxy-2-oxoglutarate aldolase